MPSRNIYKDYIPDSFYHIYNRGVDKMEIFRDDNDYKYFLHLLKRYLGSEPAKKINGAFLPSYKGQVELLAFCLMPSHFHILIYQHNEDGMKNLLKSLSVSYSMYFNKKYKRTGPLFQQRYKASRITDDRYLLHISRYIHLNPKTYNTWQWSSLPYYLGRNKADWVMPQRILELFVDSDYAQFLDEYKELREELEEIKYMLADI